jgi:hypothetical protein
VHVPYVQREDTSSPTKLEFRDRAQECFQILLNMFKIFGYHPGYGAVFNDLLSVERYLRTTRIWSSDVVPRHASTPPSTGC